MIKHFLLAALLLAPLAALCDAYGKKGDVRLTTSRASRWMRGWIC